MAASPFLERPANLSFVEDEREIVGPGSTMTAQEVNE